MSGRKPTLGYPSRTAAVAALRGQGLGTAAIARAVGIDPKTVSALEASSRQCKGLVAAGARTVLFPPDLLTRLRPHAARRDITVNDLVRRVMDALVDDNLIDAVLDDGCPAKRAA